MILEYYADNDDDDNKSSCTIFCRFMMLNVCDRLPNALKVLQVSLEKGASASFLSLSLSLSLSLARARSLSLSGPFFVPRKKRKENKGANV